MIIRGRMMITVRAVVVMADWFVAMAAIDPSTINVLTRQ